MSDDASGSGRWRAILGWTATAVAVLLVAGSFLTGLSITVRALSLLLLFATLFAVAIGTGREDSLAYPVTIAYMAFAAYTMVTFEPSRAVAPFLLLAAVIALLVLIYVLHDRVLTPTPWAASVGAPAAVVLVVLVVAVDLQTGGVAYGLDLREEVTVESDGLTRVAIGTATAESTGPFRESVSFPDARACVYTSNRSTGQSVDFGSGGPILQRSVAGGGTDSTAATILLPGHVAGSLSEPVPVERAEACPDEVDGSRIVVVPDEGW